MEVGRGASSKSKIHLQVQGVLSGARPNDPLEFCGKFYFIFMRIPFVLELLKVPTSLGMSIPRVLPMLDFLRSFSMEGPRLLF